MALRHLLAAATAAVILQTGAPVPAHAGGEVVAAVGDTVHRVKRSMFIRKHYERYDPYHYHYAPRSYYPYYPAYHRLYRYQHGHHHGHNHVHVHGHGHAAHVLWRPSYHLPRYRYAPGWGYPRAVRNWRWTGHYYHTSHWHKPWHW